MHTKLISSPATLCLLAVASFALCGCQPDVTSQGGIQFGTKLVPWGGSETLTPDDAVLISNGRCAFDIEYEMSNGGQKPAEPAFWNRIRTGATVVTQQSGLTLAAGENRTVKTQGYLDPGGHAISLTLDDENDVAESDEGNNTFSVKIELEGPCVEAPDITAKNGITIGGKAAPWGGALELDEGDAFLVSNGSCAFRVSYDMVNLGPVATAPPFWNRTRASGAVVTQQSNLNLGPGEARNILTDAYIPAGAHTVELSLDDDGQVAESEEGNNKFSLRVKVGGRCG